MVRLEFNDQEVQVGGIVSMVRNNMEIDISRDASTSTINLKVLMALIKQDGQWKILARQSVRI